MSKISLKTRKEIPLKIYHININKEKNFNVLEKRKLSRDIKLNNYCNDELIYNKHLFDSKKEIKMRRFLTDKKISRLNYKELYRFNSSSDLTNINTQNNSYREIAKGNSIHNIQIMISNSNSNNSKSRDNTENNSRKTDLNKLFSKNLINFDDRRKIKKINSSTVLRLYELYLKRKNQKLNIDDLIPINRTFSNQNIEDEKNYLNTNYNINKDSTKNLLYNYSKIQNIATHKNYNKHKKNYSLNDLMKLNPYHSVSSKVKFSDNIEMKDISEKLTELDNNRIKVKNSYKPLFFKNSNLKNNKLRKMINSFFVQFEDKISHEGDFIWRILSMMKHVNGYSPFFTSCHFKGYHELWKNYSVLLEQLLVKYPSFKWFLDRNRYIKEEVFNEFISCLKLDIKSDKLFGNKVLLLFGVNNLIDIKLFLLIMELTSYSSDILEKANFIGELLSDVKLKNQLNCINIMEMFLLLINIFNSQNYKKDIKYFKDILKNEFNRGKKFDNKLYITKNQMNDLILSNKFIQQKLNEFSLYYKNADKNYEEQINFHFNSNARVLNKILSE